MTWLGWNKGRIFGFAKEAFDLWGRGKVFA